MYIVDLHISSLATKLRYSGSLNRGRMISGAVQESSRVMITCSIDLQTHFHSTLGAYLWPHSLKLSTSPLCRVVSRRDHTKSGACIGSCSDETRVSQKNRSTVTCQYPIEMPHDTTVTKARYFAKNMKLIHFSATVMN